jgi:hypothetical protein
VAAQVVASRAVLSSTELVSFHEANGEISLLGHVRFLPHPLQFISHPTTGRFVVKLLYRRKTSQRTNAVKHLCDFSLFQVKSMLAALAVLVYATEGRFFYDFLPPLLLAEHPYAVDDTVTTVPLVLMAQNRLRVVPVADVHIAGFSLTQPLVSLLAPDVSSCGRIRHSEHNGNVSIKNYSYGLEC